MAVGGRPNEPTWVRQKGQCAEFIVPFSAGDDDLGFWLFGTLIKLELVLEQISIQELLAPFAVAKAWKIDGASGASKIAKHAIQVARRCADLFIPIESHVSIQGKGRLGGTDIRTYCDQPIITSKNLGDRLPSNSGSTCLLASV